MGKLLFQLTTEIIDIIIFGMENQAEKYYVDIKSGDILSETEVPEVYGEADIDSCVLSVPDWLPADGFQLMESFVASLHNPVHKESLSKVLSSGRGAFRNFKSTVKENELLTQQWYLHKEKVMRSRVVEWYNLNSELLKYQDIKENTDETEDLVLLDFIFSVNSSKWENTINEKYIESIRESLKDKNELLIDYQLERMKILSNKQENIPLFICAETVEGEFSGLISGVLSETKIHNRYIAVVNLIWVEKAFRGLGIARHLIDEFSKNAFERKAEEILFEVSGTGFVLGSALEARGAVPFFTTMAVNGKSM